MSGKMKMLLLLLAVLCTVCSVCSADDHWTNVKNAGVIRLGVASDYVPFVYTEGTTLDGLDIALVKEMAARLGLSVEPVDIAFDGLVDAAVIGQIDLIGGAFAITEERSAVLDYTNAYYKAGGILIARDGVTVNEDTIKTLKLGVQKGTSFEQWIASNLLMGGKISPLNVYSYNKTADTISALLAGKIDIALLDEDVWNAQYRNQSGLTAVQNRVFDEKFAFAAVKGSTLIPELNTVMREMFKDGTAQKIADTYFAKDFSGMIAPSITRPSQAENPDYPEEPADMVISREITIEETADFIASNTPGCRNGMMFVSDVSLPDRTILLPGMPAVKTWNIKNTGTCTWDSTYTFNYVKGSVLGPTSVKIGKLVAPGESYQVSVDLTTPAADGEYTAWWQMRGTEGTAFGQTIWYDIQVSASSGSSDQKVQKGAPKILKWAPDFYSTDKGKCPKVYYEVTNAYQVEFYINDKFFASSKNLTGYTSLCSPKKMGVYTFAIRAVGETAVSTAFQFIDETHYPDPMLGVNADFPHPTLPERH